MGLRAVLPPTASASGSAGIYASCPSGVYVNISGSGTVSIHFYGPNSTIYSTTWNLGPGSSARVESLRAASYGYVYVSGNASIFRAGCR